MRPPAAYKPAQNEEEKLSYSALARTHMHDTEASSAPPSTLSLGVHGKKIGSSFATAAQDREDKRPDLKIRLDTRLLLPFSIHGFLKDFPVQSLLSSLLKGKLLEESPPLSTWFLAPSWMAGMAGRAGDALTSHPPSALN